MVSVTDAHLDLSTDNPQSHQPQVSPISSISNNNDRYTSEPEPEKPVYPSAQPHAGTDNNEKAYPGAPRKTVNGTGSPDSSVDEFSKMVVEEAGHDIKFRTLSWQKATLLLFGEYVCLAILALSWSWSVVGWVGGFFITFGLGLLTWCKFSCLAGAACDRGADGGIWRSLWAVEAIWPSPLTLQTPATPSGSSA
jgi:hypothetical protein